MDINRGILVKPLIKYLLTATDQQVKLSKGSQMSYQPLSLPVTSLLYTVENASPQQE